MLGAGGVRALSVFASSPRGFVMNILFADKFQAPYLRIIEEAGHKTEFRPELSADDLPEAIAGFDVVVVRSTKVTEKTIAAADKLKMVIRAGAGTNTIDKQAAADRGIYVCNTPGKNAIAVAELAFGLLMAIDRNIPDNVADLREGRWNKKKYSKATGLKGRKVGVLGLGDIGMAFAERAHAFEMEVHVLKKANRRPEIAARAQAIAVIEHENQAELAQHCDVLSVHVPANEHTKGLIGKELLSHLKAGAIVLNTSRGSVVDDAALIEAMNEKDLRAGLDVFNDEPSSGMSDFRTELSQHPRVYGTHHIGASTEQSQNAIAAEVVEVLKDFERGTIRHCVNREEGARGTSVMTVRHFSKPGVLAGVFDRIKRAGINVEQMENQIFKGGKAAAATLNLSAQPSAEVLSQLESLEDVIAVSVKEQG